MRERLERDFERFKRELPRDFPNYVRDTYRIDLSARYLGHPLPHPIGKGSGQLSLNLEQLETDRTAGLAFVVLKTVIAEDPAGERAMAAWAIHETRMKVERRQSQTGREGWTVTWKGPRLGPLLRRLSLPGSLGRRSHPLGRDRRGALSQVSPAPAERAVSVRRVPPYHRAHSGSVGQRDSVAGEGFLSHAGGRCPGR